MEPSNVRTVTARWGRGARKLLGIWLVGSLLAACGGGSDASSGGSGSLTVGVMNAGPAYALLYWAEAKGYFDNAGLDVTISADGAGMPGNFVAGKSDVIWASQGSTLAVINGGKPVATIYGTEAGGSGSVVTANPAVDSPEDCKTVSTGTPGQALYAWTKQLEKVFGVEWRLTQLSGDVAALTSNTISGRTDCAVGSIAYFQAAVDKDQLRVVFDPTDKADLPSNWPILGTEGILAALPDTIEDKRDAFVKLVKGFDEALADYLAANPADIAKTLMDHDKGFAAAGSVDALAKTIEQTRPNLCPNKGYVSEDVWPSTLSFYQSGGLDFLANGPDKFEYDKVVDMSLYEEAVGRP
jgi:NitT/TauT family transport system substrate-binding protein